MALNSRAFPCTLPLASQAASFWSPVDSCQELIFQCRLNLRQCSLYLSGLDTNWTDIFTVGGVEICSPHPPAKATRDAIEGWLAIELPLAANAEAHDRMAAPAWVVSVVLGRKFNKGFWSSGNFLRTKLKFILVWKHWKLFLFVFLVLFCVDDYFLKWKTICEILLISWKTLRSDRHWASLSGHAASCD